MRPTHTLQISPAMVERVLQVTDTFALDRDSVVVPLKSHEPKGALVVLPDGKLLVHPPIDDKEFPAWIDALPARLAALDLRKTKRAS